MESSCLPDTRLDEKYSFSDPSAAQSVINWFACGVKPPNAIFAEYHSICFITFQKYSIINLLVWNALAGFFAFLLLIKGRWSFSVWNFVRNKPSSRNEKFQGKYPNFP